MTRQAERRDFQMDWHVLWPDVALAQKYVELKRSRALRKKRNRESNENIAWNKMCNKIEIIFIAETSICLKIKRRSQPRAASTRFAPPLKTSCHVF